jgi:hypothetical protein
MSILSNNQLNKTFLKSLFFPPTTLLIEEMIPVHIFSDPAQRDVLQGPGAQQDGGRLGEQPAQNYAAGGGFLYEYGGVLEHED